MFPCIPFLQSQSQLLSSLQAATSHILCPPLLQGTVISLWVCAALASRLLAPPPPIQSAPAARSLSKGRPTSALPCLKPFGPQPPTTKKANTILFLKGTSHLKKRKRKKNTFAAGFLKLCLPAPGSSQTKLLQFLQKHRASFQQPQAPAMPLLTWQT